MSRVTNRSSHSPNQFTYILDSVKVNLNKHEINDHYITQIVKVLYGFCKKMHPNVKNLNSRYSLFCSDNWIIENTVDFFENIPKDQINNLMKNILSENKKMNHSNRGKDLVLKKVILENILDEEEYEKEIDKFSAKQKTYVNNLEKLFEKKFQKYLKENAKIPKTNMEEVDGGRSRKRRTKSNKKSRTNKNHRY
jgi:hypothetical protein